MSEWTIEIVSTSRVDEEIYNKNETTVNFMFVHDLNMVISIDRVLRAQPIHIAHIPTVMLGMHRIYVVIIEK